MRMFAVLSEPFRLQTKPRDDAAHSSWYASTDHSDSAVISFTEVPPATRLPLRWTKLVCSSPQVFYSSPIIDATLISINIDHFPVFPLQQNLYTKIFHPFCSESKIFKHGCFVIKSIVIFILHTQLERCALTSLTHPCSLKFFPWMNEL